MGNKCKICGYRFKSSDEAICPECFTAREEDISCGSYSANEHSHARSYSAGLRDTNESFVQKELREERRNEFARENFGARANAGLDLSDFNNRYDQSRFARNDYNYNSNSTSSAYQQPTQQQSAYQRYTAQVQARQNSARTSGFTPAGQIFAQRSAFGSSQAPYNNRSINKKKNSAAAIIFLMFFVIFFIVVIAVSTANEYESRNNKSNATIKVTTTKKTTTTTTRKQKQTTTTTAKSNVDTTSGNYNCQILNVAINPIASSEISQDMLKYSSDFTGQSEPWQLMTAKIRIKPGTNYTDIQKKANVISATAQCLDSEKALTSLSYATTMLNQQIEVTDSGTEITIKALVHKDSKLIYFGINIKGAGTKESCRFRINV